MVGKCMPNSGHGGSPGTRVMTIFGSYVSVQISNIEYFEVYGGLQAPGGISSFFSLKFLLNAARIMFGDRFLSRVMTIFIIIPASTPNIYFGSNGQQGSGTRRSPGLRRQILTQTRPQAAMGTKARAPMHSTVSHCPTQCSTVLYYTMLSHAASHSTKLRCTALRCVCTPLDSVPQRTMCKSMKSMKSMKTQC